MRRRAEDRNSWMSRSMAAPPPAGPRCRSPRWPPGGRRPGGWRRRRRGPRAAASAGPCDGTAAAPGRGSASSTGAEPVRWPVRHDRHSASWWAATKPSIWRPRPPAGRRAASWRPAGPGPGEVVHGPEGLVARPPSPSGARSWPAGRRRETFGSPGTNQRQGRSAATLRPIRVPRRDGEAAATPSSTIGERGPVRVRSTPSSPCRCRAPGRAWPGRRTGRARVGRPAGRPTSRRAPTAARRPAAARRRPRPGRRTPRWRTSACRT